MPLILGANSASGGYTVKNSLRFNSGSSDYLSRTFGTATNQKIWTFSTWIKRVNLGTAQDFFDGYTSGSSRTQLMFDSSDCIRLLDQVNMNIYTTQLFRDISAWYHIVVATDTTQATASNRIKLYVNGSQVTSFSTATYPAQNTNLLINGANVHDLARTGSYANEYFDGYVSETYFIDGQQLTPSSFGQTDPSTPSSGIWIPKAYTGSYGTNGFYLKFANSASLGTDSSGLGNNWTSNGGIASTSQSTDTPTNNFATLNPLDVNGLTLTNGNLSGSSTGTTWRSTRGTFGMSKGKWYWEVKATASASSYDCQIGIGLFTLPISSYSEWSTANNSVLYNAGDGSKFLNGVNSSYGSSYTVGDIIGVAFDADNLTVTFYKNGTSQGTISTGWNADTYAIETALYGRAGGTTSNAFNFGSPSYSANSYQDAAGYGNFSYAVPSGYYALCSANLAKYG
jgi:SPRY domain/Concanavalin A-like lectin/glucanases superfamily